MRSQKGFTLLELIAVLCLIAILSSLAVHKFMTFTTSAERKLMESVLVEFNAHEKMSYLNCKMATDCDSDNYPGPTFDDIRGARLEHFNGTSAELMLDGGSTFAVYRWTTGAAAMWHSSPQPLDGR